MATVGMSELSLPRRVELDDDEMVLGHHLREVAGIKRQDCLSQLHGSLWLGKGGSGEEETAGEKEGKREHKGDGHRLSCN
jgi:hypothetical protein